MSYTNKSFFEFSKLMSKFTLIPSIPNEVEFIRRSQFGILSSNSPKEPK